MIFKTIHKLENRISSLQSLLCIGLDPELEKLPEVFQKSSEPLFSFCKEIVDATNEYAVAYKPNIAFFERFGSKGIAQFEKLVEHIQSKCPDVFIIGDIKRGDLSNTAKEYSQYYFGSLNLDSVTLSPYMGKDSLEPFLSYSQKMVFLLCLTSNPGSQDLQKKQLSTGQLFYESVADFADNIDKYYKSSCGIVVGATHPEELAHLRKNHPELYFLIPGVGAQGGELEQVVAASGKKSLINISRSILFSSSGNNFAEKARESASNYSTIKRLYKIEP